MAMAVAVENLAFQDREACKRSPMKSTLRLFLLLKKERIAADSIHDFQLVSVSSVAGDYIGSRLRSCCRATTESRYSGRTVDNSK